MDYNNKYKNYAGSSRSAYYSNQYDQRYSGFVEPNPWHVVPMSSYLGTFLGFVFLTISLACGLYYLAELVEEYTVLAKKVIRWTIIVVCLIYPFLWIVDGLPWPRVLFGLACHAFFSLLLEGFPVIRLTSWVFLLSCVLAVVNHFVWFSYFTRHQHTFAEVASFFGLYVWLVPFEFFISLSANENVLPTNIESTRPSSSSSFYSASGEPSSSNGLPGGTPRRGKNRNLVRWLVDHVWKGNRGDVLPSLRGGGGSGIGSMGGMGYGDGKLL